MSAPPNGSPRSGGWLRSAFALFASFAENLIQAVNIVGSIFYGVVLGMFLVAFFLKRVGGTAVFWAALVGADAGLRALLSARTGYPVLEFRLSLVQPHRLRRLRGAEPQLSCSEACEC